MKAYQIVSPEDQGATFVELFFDLVFVFAITQLTHYAAHHLDLHGLFRSVLIFWLVWWGWTQFTWALNAANTEHHRVRAGTLIATGIAFVMAVSIEKAFSAEAIDSLWFAASYAITRLLGLGLYYQVVSESEERRSAVINFAALSVLGLSAVVGGAFAPPWLRDWIWFVAVLLDLSAAWFVGNTKTWGVHPGHFAERHGLIVIIALGESLIVAGSSLTDDVTTTMMITGMLAVLVTCLLWWTYFGWVAEVLEHAMADRGGQERPKLARDAFTFMHFPLVSGIIALAVGFEASFHPADYSTLEAVIGIGVGLTLFLVSTATALWRARGCIPWGRLVMLAGAIVGFYFVRSSPAIYSLGLASVALATIVWVEQITIKRKLATN